MPARFHPAALVLLALAGCADDAPPPPPVSGGRTAASAPASTAPTRTASAGPVTTFDGRYTGSVTLTPDRTRLCPDGAPQVEMTVRNGRATFVINPATRQTLSGTVAADGTIQLRDPMLVDRSVATTGAFSERGFTGQHRSGLCVYAVSLTLG